MAQVNPAPKLVEVARGAVATPYGPIMESWGPLASSTEQGRSQRILLRVEAPKDILVKLAVRGVSEFFPLTFRGTFEDEIELA